MYNESRSNKGIFCGLVGIVCNLVLSSFKIFIGLVAGSISVLLDGINNLIDVFTAGATSIGFSMTKRERDSKYINGYGRIEYIISFIISIVIIVVGIAFLWSSIERILMPQPLTFSWVYFYIILSSIIVKFAMAEFYRRYNKKIDSVIIEGLVIDSYQDGIITIFALLAFLISRFTPIPVDAFCGMIIAIIIIVNSSRLLKRTYSKLMGASDNEKECEILDEVLQEYDIIDGVENLILNDFGYGQKVLAFDIIASGDCNEIDRAIEDIKNKLTHKTNMKIIIGKGRVSDYEKEQS